MAVLVEVGDSVRVDNSKLPGNVRWTVKQIDGNKALISGVFTSDVFGGITAWVSLEDLHIAS